MDYRENKGGAQVFSNEYWTADDLRVEDILYLNMWCGLNFC